MRVNMSMSGAVLPGLIAGLIYFVIAFATGASVVASIIGGVAVALMTIVIGLAVRAVRTRRNATRRN